MFSFNSLTNLVFYWLGRRGKWPQNTRLYFVLCESLSTKYDRWLGILDIISSFWAHVVDQQDRVLFACWKCIKLSRPGQFPSAWPKHLGCCSHTCGRCFWMRMMAWVNDCWMPCIWHSPFHVNSGENRAGLHDYTFTDWEILWVINHLVVDYIALFCRLISFIFSFWSSGGCWDFFDIC